MRYLLWMINSSFCKHTFVYEEKWFTKKTLNNTKQFLIVSATCKKCGWHRRYNKFN